ncbi:alpha/beta hydrolase [Actinotalea sp. M2MS4P-6]|uniref:alpha/beta hydrolase n=1 Tax=Actinotalea sp. M2MS4P-6 TaxID=2983762 RepID=UPI0021E360BC|nr:alpha/beta hydrolase [Actinotalea sp. M2MS4P-6]MCV2393877.1 alpha/beta hydrolase [Actinotalea sp. M2MS4P-6]
MANTPALPEELRAGEGTEVPRTWDPPLVEPRPVPLDDFPPSEHSTERMSVLLADHTPRHGTAWLAVEYAAKSGRRLHLQIVAPPVPPSDDAAGAESGRRFPLVVFVQGSAWGEQMLGQELPALAHFAARGYVVAVVEYRPSDVAPFPAQVRDTRSAVRFLRTHADRYRIDPSRVALWGDSSGAHTALLTALTEGDPEYSDEPDGEPLHVSCVVDYYGPTDIARMNEEPSVQDHVSPTSPEGMLIGGHDVLARPDLVAPTVLAGHLHPDRDVPPVLMVHGSRDRLVPFGQSVLLHDALVDAGRSVELYQLRGADHGGPPFWQEPVLDLVDGFLRLHLPPDEGLRSSQRREVDA